MLILRKGAHVLKHIWSVLCRKSIIDTETNNISINEVFEQLGVDIKTKEPNKLPEGQINVPIEWEMVSMWVSDNTTIPIKAEYEVVIIDPKGNSQKSFVQPIEIAVGMRRMRTRMKVMGLIINEQGDYLFKVGIKESGQKEFKTVAELPLEVKINKELLKENAKKA